MIPLAIIVYIVLSIVTDVIVFYYIGRWNRYNVFSPLRFLLILMVLLLQIPAWVMAFSDRAIGHEFSIACGLVASAIVPLLVLLGSKLIPRPAITWRQWWQQPLYYNPSHKIVAGLFCGVIVIGILLQVFVVGGFRGVPLVANFLHPGQGAMLRDLREQAFKLQPLYVKYPIAFSRHVLSFVAVSVLVVLVVHKLRGRAWLVPILVLAVVNAAMQGAKDPPAAILLVALLTWLLVSGKRIRARTIIVGFLVLSIFPLFFTLTRLGTSVTFNDIGRSYSLLSHRLFIAPASCVMSTFAYVPDISGEFFYGRTINLWATVTGRETAPLPNLVYLAWVPPGGSRTSFSNAAFYADAWANFWWVGVVVISLLVGAFIGLFERIILTSRKTLLSIACLICMIVGARQLISMPFTSWVLSDVGSITLLIVFLTKQSNVSDEGMDLLEAYAEEPPPFGEGQWA